MIGPEARASQRLPGTDTLRSARLLYAIEPSRPILAVDAAEHVRHRDYLNHPTYASYIALPKQGGADISESLRATGDELAREEMPIYLDAGGWAYAEAGLVAADWSVSDRVESVRAAEALWQRALINQQLIREDKLEAPHQFDASDEHRLALNLAYTPLMKSIIVGNVTESVRRQAFRDTVAIAADASLMLDDAWDRRGAGYDKASLIGFLYEANALATLLVLDDPRYIPMPSTARADSGYYHREQTHDIMVINQHWGDIRKIIPLEIKARASLQDRRRYHALVIRGRMHLNIEGIDPRATTELFQSIASGMASVKEISEVERLATNIREMLRLYQQGVTEESVASDSMMRFHDKTYLSDVYPDASPYELDGRGRPVR